MDEHRSPEYTGSVSEDPEYSRRRRTNSSDHKVGRIKTCPVPLDNRRRERCAYKKGETADEFRKADHDDIEFEYDC